jgi:hypothetical protein
LRCSIALVRYWQSRGVLRPTLGADGIYRFSKLEVEALARKRGADTSRLGLERVDPELVRRAMVLIGEGEPLSTVVIHTGLLPDRVRELWRDYHAGYAREPAIGDPSLGDPDVPKRKAKR